VEFDPDQHDRIVVLQPADGWPSRSNLGIFSSRTVLWHSWVVEPNVTLLLAERFGRADGPEVLATYEPTELGPGDFGLDLRPLRNRLCLNLARWWAVGSGIHPAGNWRSSS
jgi:hypothetical protein